MSKTVKAVYDDASNSLILSEPLEGFADGEFVSVIVDHVEAKKPWSDTEGNLIGENAETFARAIEKAFPIEQPPRRTP